MTRGLIGWAVTPSMSAQQLPSSETSASASIAWPWAVLIPSALRER
ncbi:MAG: hypothetical protein OXC62_09025 [Aestuariivita sp.]|nr:hypothetical protein [Aestuariivita sp.]